MATTYSLISSVTVGSGGAANISFTSIPATYTDLLIKYSATTNDTGVVTWTKLTFNGSTSGYSDRYMRGNGVSVISGTDGSDSAGAAGFGGAVRSTATASGWVSPIVQGNVEIYIPNYAGSNNKSYSVDGVIENNDTFTHQSLIAGLWSNSSAITSLNINATSTFAFQQYSTFYLYGISNA
jgi:hypothetical protein